MPILPGDRLGRYEIVHSLATSEADEVYRARDVRLKRDVALKVLPEEHRFDARRIARLECEAQTLAAVNLGFGLADAAAIASAGSDREVDVSAFGRVLHQTLGSPDLDALPREIKTLDDGREPSLVVVQNWLTGLIAQSRRD